MPLQTQITHKLKSLTPHTVPLFRKMTAQHMVEHLMFSVMFSNGKWPRKLYLPPEKAKIIKQNLIYSNMEMPVGFKAPMLGEELPKLNFPNLDDAIAAL